MLGQCKAHSLYGALRHRFTFCHFGFTFSFLNRLQGSLIKNFRQAQRLPPLHQPPNR
jgi:hypothetical protein